MMLALKFDFPNFIINELQCDLDPKLLPNFESFIIEEEEGSGKG